MFVDVDVDVTWVEKYPVSKQKETTKNMFWKPESNLFFDWSHICLIHDDSLVLSMVIWKPSSKHSGFVASMAMVGVGPNFNDVGIHGSPSMWQFSVFSCKLPRRLLKNTCSPERAVYRALNIWTWITPSRVELSLEKPWFFRVFFVCFDWFVFYMPKITQFWNSGGLNNLEHVCVHQ